MTVGPSTWPNRAVELNALCPWDSGSARAILHGHTCTWHVRGPDHLVLLLPVSIGGRKGILGRSLTSGLPATQRYHKLSFESMLMVN